MTKDIKRKIKEFNLMIELYPGIRELYVGRGKLYEELKQYKKALQDYNKAYANYFCYDLISICERNGLVRVNKN